MKHPNETHSRYGLIVVEDEPNYSFNSTAQSYAFEITLTGGSISSAPSILKQ